MIVPPFLERDKITLVPSARRMRSSSARVSAPLPRGCDVPGDNFLVQDHHDLVIKDSYWVWPSQTMKGNAIDFFMLVECRSFNEAMQILAPPDPDLRQ